YLNAVRLCLPMPCPVLLGTVKGGGLSALLHRYTIEKKVAKVEKVLKKGLHTSGAYPIFFFLMIVHVSLLLFILHLP
uniref:Uncharacterized protein n=1 Tax=Sinocyclocheilus anshuiensis TaxID=1608454 RepID=A0A671NE29_9TELE